MRCFKMKNKMTIKSLSLVLLLSSIAIPTTILPNDEISAEHLSLSTLRATPLYDIKQPTNYQYLVQNEPYYTAQQGSQYAYLNPGNVMNQYRGEGVTVAIIDTGLRYDADAFNYNGKSRLSDLSACVTSNSTTEITTVKSVRDNNGDYSILQEDATVRDEDNNPTLIHGTSVAGTIFDIVDGKNGFGLASNVTYIHVKLSNLYLAEMAYALEYILSLNTVDVLNMSFGFVGYPSSETEMINAALNPILKALHDQGTLIVAAAGNDATMNDYFPACNDYVLSIGALKYQSFNELAYYSTYGHLDLVAPGTVYVPHVQYNNPYRPSNFDTSINTYAHVSGTSFASPLVASSAALYMNKYQGVSNETTKYALLGSATDIGLAGYDTYFGYGRLNLNNLMNYLPEYADADAFCDHLVTYTLNGVDENIWYDLSQEYVSLSEKGKDYLPESKFYDSMIKRYNQIVERYEYGDFLDGEMPVDPNLNTYILIISVIVATAVIAIIISIITVKKQKKMINKQ